MKAVANGLLTGLTLQLAVGPVFLFLVNLTLQKSILDGLAGALAVTTVDLFYISLAILGVGRVLERQSVKRLFGIIGPLVLLIFGIFILRNVLGTELDNAPVVISSGPMSSFASVFALTISSPMTIIFFTGIFSTKAIEYRYTRLELWSFGLGAGLAPLLFMGISMIAISFLGNYIPMTLVRLLNMVVGVLLIGYGTVRLFKSSVTSDLRASKSPKRKSSKNP